MSTLALAVALVAITLTTKGAAQTTDAQCLPFYSWTGNSHKQSPCQVAATLISACTPAFNVAGLPDGTHYVGPSMDMATPCQCNTVVYSLISACGACQGRTYSSWSEWTANCASVTLESYPEALPPNTYIPAWAYLDVQTNDRFNETAARLAVNGTEHTAPTPSSTSSQPVKTSSTKSGTVKTTSTRSTSLSTSMISSASSSTPSAASSGASSSSSSTSDPRLNAIVGGTVGGVLGLGLIVTLAIWLVIRHRERRAKYGRTLPSSTNVSEPGTTPEPNHMVQYVQNTVPEIVTPSVTTTSLPTPTSVRFPASASASVNSIGHSNV